MFKNILKTTIRSLLKNPSHSFVNIFGLSVGLATVFMIMLWANYHFSFDDFHRQKQRIFKVLANNTSSTGEVQTTEGATYEIMEAASENISDIDQFTRVVSNWRWPSEQCFKVDNDKPCIYSKGIYADSSFFEIFDIEIIHGDRNPLKSPYNIALSQSLAKKLYGDENPVGKIYKMDNHLEVTVATVYNDLPANSTLSFGFIAPLDVVHTLWMGKNFDLKKVQKFNYITYLTADPENTVQVEEAINSLEKMESYQGTSYFLFPFADNHLYDNFEQGKASGGLMQYINIFILFGLFILIMSAVNFINLATAKATIRSKEIGVRKVTGASKAAIMGQFLLEAFVKVIIATGLALLMVFYALPMLNKLIGEEVRMVFDLNFILIIAGVIILSTLLAGAYPSFVLSSFNPVKALKSKEGVSGGGRGVRKWLTVLQIGFSVVIIVVTSIIYMQLSYIQNKNIGYDREGVMILEPTYRHIKNYDNFKNELMSNHLIKAVGVSNANMIDASYATDQVSWPGKSPDEKVLFKLIGGSQGLLEVFELELSDGVGFNETDTVNQVILTKSADELAQPWLMSSRTNP